MLWTVSVAGGYPYQHVEPRNTLEQSSLQGFEAASRAVFFLQSNALNLCLDLGLRFSDRVRERRVADGAVHACSALGPIGCCSGEGAPEFRASALDAWARIPCSLASRFDMRKEERLLRRDWSWHNNYFSWQADV